MVEISGGKGQVPAVRVKVAAWRWAVIKSDLPAGPKQIVLLLSVLMNADGSIPRKYWPGIRKLSDYASRRLDTVIRSIKHLKADGWLLGEKGSGTRPSEYLAAVPLSATLGDDPAVPVSGLAMPLSGLSVPEKSNQPAHQHVPARADSLNPSECDHAPEDSDGYCTKCKTLKSERSA